MSSSKQDQPERSGKKPVPPGFPPQPPGPHPAAGGPLPTGGDLWGDSPSLGAGQPPALPYLPNAGSPLDGPPSSLRPPPDSVYSPSSDQLWKDSLPPQAPPERVAAPPPPRPSNVAPPDFLLPPAAQTPSAPPSEAIRGAGVGDLWTESLPPQRSSDPRAGWQAAPAAPYPAAPSPPPGWNAAPSAPFPAPPQPYGQPPSGSQPSGQQPGGRPSAAGGANQPWAPGTPANTPAAGYDRGRQGPSAGAAVDSGLQMVGGGTTLGDSNSMRPTYASGGVAGQQGTVPTGAGPTIYGSGAPSPRSSSTNSTTGSGGTHATTPTGAGPTVYGSGIPGSSISGSGGAPADRRETSSETSESWRMFKESAPPAAGGSPPTGAAPAAPGSAEGWAALADSFPQRNKDSHVLRSSRGQSAAPPPPGAGLFSSNPPAGAGPEASTVLQDGAKKGGRSAPQPVPPPPPGGYDIDDLLRQSMGEPGPEGGVFQSAPPTSAAPEAPAANPVFDSQPPAPFRAARPVHLDEVIARPMRLEQIEGNVALRDEKLEARNKLWDESLPPSASPANRALSNESNTTSSINRQLLAGEGKVSESRLRLAEQVERIWADSSLDQYHIGQTISRRGAKGKSAIGENLKMRSIVEPRKDQASPQIADYESLGVLGEGGMGKVWLGRQAGLGRELAIKMLRSDFAGDDEIKARFLAEAVATAALEHPGVVPVHELGRTQNRDIFYSMKRVKGYPWCDKLGEKSLRENLEILVRVCDAIAYAHSEFVIHRDLKPENVMLGDYGEVYVMDWGLSVSVDARGKAFRAEDRENQAGSPSYMAPEMACGWESKLTEASDVYLLGAMLFEILTHNPPHTGSNVKQCLINAAANEIVPFDKDKLPLGTWELMQIALKAMASEQEDRYPTVKEFQGAIREFESHHDSIDLAARAMDYHRKAQTKQGYDDFAQALFGYRAALDKWADNEEAQAGIRAAAKEYAEAALAKGDYDLAESLLPELADDAELASRVQRQKQIRQSGERTRRMLWSGLVLASVVIMAGLAVGLGLIEQQRQVALGAQKAAEDDRKIAVVSEKKATEAAEIARKEKEAADAEREKVKGLNDKLNSTIDDLKTQTDLAKKATAAAKLEQERAVASEVKAVDSAAEAKKEKEKAEKALKDLKTSQEAVQTEAKKAVYEAYVAKVGLYQTKIDQNYFRQGGETFSQLLAAAGSPTEQALRGWEWGRLRFLSKLFVESFSEKRGAPLSKVAALPDGRRFVTLSERGEAFLWTIGEADPVLLMDHKNGLRALAVAADGRIFIGADDGTIHTATVQAPKAVKWNKEPSPKDKDGGDPRTTALQVSPDQKKLVAGYSSGALQFWTMEGRLDGQPREGVHESTAGHAVLDVAFTPDGRGVASVGEEGAVALWAVGENGSAWENSTAHGGRAATCVTVIGRGKAIDVVTGGMDGYVRVWRSEVWNNVGARLKFEKAADFPAHERGVCSLTLGVDRTRLFSTGEDNVAAEWTPVAEGSARYALVRRLRGHGSAVTSASQPAQAPELLLTASADGSAKSWNLRTYHEEFVLATSSDPAGSPEVVAISNRQSADGAVLLAAAAGELGAVAWISSPSGREWSDPRLLSEGHSDPITRIALFEQGDASLAATCCPSVRAADRSIRIWDLKTQREIRRLEGHDGSVNNVVFSPDGGRLLSVSSDGSAVLWDVKSGAKIHRIPSPGKQALHSAAFLADGGKVLLGGMGGVFEFSVAPTVAQTNQYLVGDDFHTRGQAIVDLFLLPKGRILSASRDNTAIVTDLATGKRVGERMNPKSPIRRAAVSSDKRRVVLADDSHNLSFWDAETGAALPIRAPVGSLIQSLAVHEKDVVVCTKDADLRWFALDDPRLVRRTSRPAVDPKGGFSSAVLLKDGQVLAAVYEQGRGSHLEVWSREMKAPPVAQIGLHTEVVGVAVAPPGAGPRAQQWVYTCSREGQIKLWDAEVGRVERVYKAIPDFGDAAAFALSPSGAMIAVGSRGGEVVLFDPVAGAVVKRHQIPSQTLKVAIRSLRFAAREQLLLVAASDGRPRLWPLDAEQPIVLADTREKMLDLTLSHDGESLAAAFEGGKVLVLAKDAAAAGGWKTKMVLAGHSEAVRSVVFSPPDDRRIVTASLDGTVKVWDAQLWPGREGVGAVNGQELLTLRADQEFTAVEFSADGLNIIAATTDGKVFVWPALPWIESKAGVALQPPSARPVAALLRD